MKKLNPLFTISPEMANNLMRIEAIKTEIEFVPINISALVALRETARLSATHYSTVIEGNRLTLKEVGQVIADDAHFIGRARDQQEVKGYFAALDAVEALASLKKPVTILFIQELHALVMGHGNVKVTPTSFRDGQNVIREAATGAIIYLPPEALDVLELMEQLCQWIEESVLVPPLVAAIAHYQFATIHPYLDGNGRTARLLVTYLLHRSGFDLKGIYNLEEYYAQNLFEYYKALQVGQSHNYYEGRVEADISGWIEYFIKGMAESFEKVFVQTIKSRSVGIPDKNKELRNLDVKQRKILQLFKDHSEVTAAQIAKFFGFNQQQTNYLCKSWVKSGFFIIGRSAKKTRSYRLAFKYGHLVKH